MKIHTTLSVEKLTDIIWDEMTNQYPEYNFMVFANGETLPIGKNETYTGTQPILYYGPYSYPEAFREYEVADENGLLKDNLTDEVINNFKDWFISRELVQNEGYRGDPSISEPEEIDWESDEENEMED